jgi:hypothetical protein
MEAAGFEVLNAIAFNSCWCLRRGRCHANYIESRAGRPRMLVRRHAMEGPVRRADQRLQLVHYP